MLNVVLIALQLFQVAFLWIHDWVPLGNLNDVAAVRRQDSVTRLVRVTLIQSVPYSIGLFYSVLAYSHHHRFPAWLESWLWISYGLLFAGEINAWWLPYLTQPSPQRAARYQAMFGRTHAFLPHRHGIVPNTLHCLLHAPTAATLVVLSLQPG
jgi:hypothetical protein